MTFEPDAALLARAAAALELVRHHELDGALALSYVAAPSVEVEQASVRRTANGRRGYSEATRRRALELVASGASWSAAGREVGAPKTTSGVWVRAGRVPSGHPDAATLSG